MRITSWLMTIGLCALITVTLTSEQSARHKRDTKCAAKFKRIPNHTACKPKSSDVTVSGVSDKDKKIILNYHNKVRGMVKPTASDMLKLEWDDEVAMIAQKWADTCAKGHDKNIERSIPGRFAVGQNLAFGYGSWELAMKGWFDENKLFTFGDKTKNNFAAVGHYTAMVWAKTKLVGCGYSVCPNTYYKKNLFCNYSPSGNAGDWSKPYKVGRWASACPKHAVGKLCNCGVCENGATQDLRTCNCKCAATFYTKPTCKLDCSKVKEPASCTYYKKKPNSCHKYSNVPQSCPLYCKVCPLDDPSPGPGGSTNNNRDRNAATTPVHATIALLLVLISHLLI